MNNKQGYCPCCGSDLLNYESVKFEGEMLFFPWTCENCKSTGEEWYTMDFTSQEIKENKNNEESEGK